MITREQVKSEKSIMRGCRILLIWGMCIPLAVGGGPRWTAVAQQTPQQREQERERQQEQERQREEEQQRQREQQQERQQQQEQAREREQQQQQEREEQQQQRAQEQQQREQQEREAQQREQQQRENEQQQRAQQQREAQQREQQQQAQQQREREQEERQHSLQRDQEQRPSGEPVLKTRQANPDPIRPPHEPENPQQSPGTVMPVRPQPGPIRSAPAPGLGRGSDPAMPARPAPNLLGGHPALPHPIKLPVPVLPDHRIDPFRRDPPRPVGRPPVVTERPIIINPAPRVVIRPSTEVILGLAPPPRRAVVLVGQPTVAVMAAPPMQAYAAAQARLQAAQNSCVQADAYQSYVNSVASNQNNLSQGVDQVLQTIADNTSDPDTQNAILSSIGQPNPINDALQQQLQAQAGTYETICQNRLAAAQAAMPPDSSAQSSPQPGAPQPNAPLPNAADGQPGAVAADASSQGAALAIPAGTPAAPPTPQAQPCTSGVRMALPQANSPWGAWVPLGNTGLVFGVSRVNATTLTWRFLNAGSQTVASMNFNYTFVDANSGQATTQSDLLPYALQPGQSVGGWAAYTANTRGNVSLQITQIACQ